MYRTAFAVGLILSTWLSLATCGVAADRSQIERVNHAVLRPAPGDAEAPSELYQVSVEGRPVHVYRCRVSAVPFNQTWPGYQRPEDQTEEAAFAGWDMSGPVRVEVIASRPIKRVTVRPLASGISPQVDPSGRRFSFQLQQPAQLVIEVNDAHQALHLFADPVEQEPPQKGTPGVRYFGPGVHEPGPITLRDHETVYLAPGAVVHGTIQAERATDVRVLGRGILDISRYERKKSIGGILLDRCRNVRVEGITIRDPAAWTVELDRCEDATVAGIKLIGLWRYNSDGIDAVSSQKVHIRDCFVRAFDDNIVIKSRPNRKGEDGYPCRDITAERCVLWNDWNVAIKVGTETGGPEIRDIHVNDCHVIRCTHAALGIQTCDGAVVRNVRFEDIHLEVGENQEWPAFQKHRHHKYIPREGLRLPKLLDLNVWARGGKGRIENVTLQNISVTAPQMPPSRLVGLDETHGIDGVTFENLTLNGRPIHDAQAAGLVLGKHVKNVRFANGGRKAAKPE
ncbi:MAG: glycosyl hydrolase family 28 protein [Thermoguttaceae bacterium]